jgi:phosphoribosylformylglycinamidine (FGAM) synthase-like amidotransferase family enzyme
MCHNWARHSPNLSRKEEKKTKMTMMMIVEKKKKKMMTMMMEKEKKNMIVDRGSGRVLFSDDRMEFSPCPQL